MRRDGLVPEPRGQRQHVEDHVERAKLMEAWASYCTSLQPA